MHENMWARLCESRPLACCDSRNLAHIFSLYKCVASNIIKINDYLFYKNRRAFYPKKYATCA